MAHKPKRRCARPGCDKTFEITNQWARKYCTTACSSAAHLENIARHKRESRVTPAKRPCRSCGKEFTPVRTQKYCSPKCAAAGHVAAIERQRQRRAEGKVVS